MFLQYVIFFIDIIHKYRRIHNESEKEVTIWQNRLLTA